MRRLGRDGIAGVVCLVGSLALLALTIGLPRPTLVPIGPGFYPRIVFVITAVLAAALVVSDLRAGHPAPARVPATGHLVAATFAIFAAYVLVLPYLGYRLATFAFMVALQATLTGATGRIRWVLVVAMAGVTTLATYYIFEGYLSVLLPRGHLTGF